MSDEKFTPGPWNVFDNGLIFVQPPPDSGTLVIAGCGTSFIGDGGEQAQWQIDRNRANAHLIAAAPEMYDVIDRLVPWLEHDPNADSDEYCAFAKEMRRILKKARGES